jgi:hypothetical protein
MIAIDHVLISEDIIDEQFVCDLSKCKGGCCEDGDAGAPMEKWELEKLKKYYEALDVILLIIRIALILLLPIIFKFI